MTIVSVSVADRPRKVPATLIVVDVADRIRRTSRTPETLFVHDTFPPLYFATACAGDPILFQLEGSVIVDPLTDETTAVVVPAACDALQVALS